MLKASLHIEVYASETLALLESIRADLESLKKLPEFPIEQVLNLGDSIVTQLSVGAGCTAIVAGDDRIFIKPVRMLEIFASTLGALNLYVHAVLPQQS